MSMWNNDPNTHLHSVPVHRGQRAQFKRRHIYLALGATVAIVAITVAVIWRTKTAQSAGDHAAVVSTVTPTRLGTAVPSRAPVEVAPPLAEAIPGDGTWLIGAEIKAGTYRSAGGATCYWSRLSNLSGEFDAILASSFGQAGPQKVALGSKDKAFASQGCGSWELVS